MRLDRFVRLEPRRLRLEPPVAGGGGGGGGPGAGGGGPGGGSAGGAFAFAALLKPNKLFTEFNKLLFPLDISTLAQ